MQNSTAPVQQSQDEDNIDLLALLGILLDGKWIIFGATLLLAVIGVSYAILATPIYQANALVQIEEKSGGGLAATGELSEMLGGTSRAITEIELLKSRSVIGQAVDNLQLTTVVEPNYFPVIGEWVARQYKAPETGGFESAPLGLDSFAWGGEILSVFQLEVPASYLGLPLTLTAKEDDSYILSHDGEEILAGKVGEQATQGPFRVQIATLSARPGTEFTITKRSRISAIQTYQGKLEVAETGRDSRVLSLIVEDASPAHATSVLNEISRLYVLQNVERSSAEAAQSLEFLRDQLPIVRKELERYEEVLNKYRTSTQSVDISIETKSVLDQIVELDTRISQLKLDRSEMERRFTREHPSFQALLEQTQQLEQQKSELNKKVGNLPETQQELLRLSRDVAVTTEVYSSMLNRAQELDVVRAGTVGNVRIIDQAAVSPQAPVKPKKGLIIVIAVFLGGVIGIAIVLLRHALNRGVEDPDVIEQLGLPVYAAIPYSKSQEDLEKHTKSRSRNASQDSFLLAVNDPADLAVESLRSLRTSLHFARLESKNNMLMISGPSPSVGKSFVSANLGAVMAQAGQKVLLIDSDMRKGFVHKMFKMKPDNGLSDLLAATITSAECIYETEVPNLHVVPRGQIPPNPSELLMHPNFNSFLDNVKDQYDIVIIDTPPILAVTDAAIVGRQAGISLIVTRFGLNAAREIEITKRRFEQNNIQLKGAIFNAVERKASAYGYGHYGYYNYEYKSDKN